MQRVLLQLQAKNPWKEAMRKSCRVNKLNVDLVSYFTPLRFRTAYLKFATIYDRKKDDRSQRWLQNELKAFYWMCVAVSCISSLLIAEFREDQWTLLSQIFITKSKMSLEYEAKKMVEEIVNKTNWLPQQDQMLTEIAKKSDSSYKWNDFARRLYEESSKQFLRTGKQCRERWLNHLDPSKKHGDWNNEEDRQIVLLYLQLGKKWSSIAKKLGSCRTQHMIKNRYKTICSKQKKLHPNIKTEEELMRIFVNSPKEEIDKKQQLEIEQKNQIKTQEKSHQIDEESEQKEFEVNELVVQQENKSKGCPLLNHSFEVYSPWYVSIPLTPNFSPNVPFFINFSTATFSSLDSNFSNQFCCVKKSSEDKCDF